MMRFTMRRVITGLITMGAIGITFTVNASGFQLWEQSAASVGNYHAGYAAEAADASINFYNPAGITRFKNQQFVIGAAAILTSFKYRGDVSVSTIFANLPMGVTAQGGTFNVVPNLHYVAPITDSLSFGFSVVAPFGLQTDYGRSTILRYAATLTSVAVVDYNPTLAYQVMDNLSIGLGLDIQTMKGKFDMVAGSGLPENDTESTNRADGSGYGFDAGILYQATPCTRLGLSYHSQVVHHLSGSSKFIGPIAQNINEAIGETGDEIVSQHAKVKVTLPPYTAFSVYHEINNKLAVMGSLIYTQWNTFQSLTLKNIAGVVLGSEGFPDPSTAITVSIPQNYRNTWNAAAGLNYYITDKLMFRTGIGYDQTPVRNRYRTVQLPDSNRIVIALGGHYQACKTLGIDLGWSHFFAGEVDVNPPPTVLGIEVVTTNGKVSGGADAFGAQITWDII